MTYAGAAGAIDQGLGFERFFETEYQPLVRALYLLTGSAAEAEDLAQEALTRAYERWDRVSAMKSPVGYVYRTAFNLDRRRVRRLLVLARKLRPAPFDAADPAGAAEAHSDVLRALLSLPAGQREALVLVELLGLGAEEVGVILGIKAASVRARLSRARTSFRTALGEGYG